MNIFIPLRIMIGILFIVSGGEKLIGPYQNFLYVVSTYEIFPSILEEVIARGVPWVELILGLFLLLGLWTLNACKGALILFTGFIIIVTQAIIRDLPITECGCFGELLSFPLNVVLLFDSCMFFICFYLIKKIHKTSQFSLDKVFGDS